MRALIFFIARVLTYLAAFPLAAMLVHLVWLRNETDGDAGLVFFPLIVGFAIVLACIAAAANTFLLTPTTPEPAWLRSRVVRLEVRALVVAIIFTAAATTWEMWA